MAKITIDCTPLGLKTPEGQARAARANADWHDAQAASANALRAFLRDHGADLDVIIAHWPEPDVRHDLHDALDDLRADVLACDRAQDAFLRAVAGTPVGPDSARPPI